MIFSLTIAVLVLAVAIIQASQGFFSALIMTVLTLCCAGAAFGTYEWVAVNLLVEYWKPDYAHAVSLALVFGVPLVILRVTIDKLIRRSCLLPVSIDRAGGGVCGLLTGLVMVGVMASAIQMLPFGGSILGYARFDRAVRDKFGDAPSQPPDVTVSDRNLLLSPDRFATGTASVLSAGVFSGERSFFQDHPNVVQAAGWVNAVQADVSRYAPPRSISIVGTQPVAMVYRLIPGNDRNNTPDQYEPIESRGGQSLHMIRVELKNEARDARKSHVFTLRQFRLVGQEESDGPYRQYFPIAVQQSDAGQSVNRHVRFKQIAGQDWPVVDEVIIPRDGNENQVELVFELPPRFVPSFLEYKRGARANVSFDANTSPPETPNAPRDRGQRTDAAPVTTDATTASAPATEPAPANSGRRSRRRRSSDTVASTQRGGRIRGVATLSGQSFFGDEMPQELKSYRGIRDVELRRGSLSGGHLLAELDKQEEGDDTPVTKFDVPSDKRLLHLNVGKLQARSGLGRAIASAVAVAQNYFVEDSNGSQHRFVGKYAIASVRGKQVLEIQYFPEVAGSIGGVGKFNRIKEDKLKRDEPLVLLFLVDPGTRIVSFSTGGDASRRDDLTSENLVAPQ